MRKTIIAVALSMFIAAIALAHSGHVHNFLGTVKSSTDTKLVITTREAKEVTFTLTRATEYTRGGKAAHRDDLKRGTRVAVHVANDGKTATSIKIAK